jgi:cold shock protein
MGGTILEGIGADDRGVCQRFPLILSDSLLPAIENFSTGGNTMAQGIVKWFNEKKGFGFIQQDGGGDLFVHYTAIKAAGFRSLQEGQRVQFEVETTDRGPKAKNVEMM